MPVTSAVTRTRKARETSVTLLAVIEGYAKDGMAGKLEATDFPAVFAEIADYAAAVGDYLTGDQGFRIGKWLDKWQGIELA